jgi:hypothetical protein
MDSVAEPIEAERYPEEFIVGIVHKNPGVPTQADPVKLPELKTPNLKSIRITATIISIAQP